MVNKQIKIVFFSKDASGLFYDNNLRYTGSDIQFSLIARELANDPNFNVFFLFFADSKTPKYSKKDNIHLFKIKDYGRLSFEDVLRFRKVIKKINPDIILFNSNPELSFLYFVIKNIKAKKILRITNDLFCDNIQGNFFERLFFKNQIKTSNIIIVQHIKQKELLKKNFNKDSIVIKNAMKIPRYNNKRRRYFLWIGDYSKNKRYELVLKLAKNIPKKKFLMILPYESKTINNEIKDLNNIRIIPRHIDFDKTERFFKSSIGVLLTSKNEGFSNVLIQAGAFGSPILSYEWGCDLIKEHDIGFCAERNFDKFKQELEMLASNPGLWNDKSKNIFNYVKENHNLTKIIKKWKKLFFNLMNIKY